MPSVTPPVPDLDAIPRLVASPGRLGPAERSRNLDRLDSEVFDVVVVGGGVVGVGCALDAVTRGLSVALVEQRDLASGTSSRSSKLIHGGLRYLEQFEFGLVREALRERGLLMDRLAPHLVHPVSFLYPLQHRGWERIYVGAGVLLYDLLAATGVNPLPRHRHLSKRAALELMPSLRADTLAGAVQYWDGQVDDARHTMTVARTAAHFGAVVVTSARATGFMRDGDRVTGVQVQCLETGRRIDVRARQVVNATGVWTDEIEELAGEHKTHVRASKGIHIVVPRDRIDSSTGMIIRTEKSVLFLIPWGEHWIIGTTDTEWNLDLAHPAASHRDIEYLLEHVNSVLARPITEADIVGVYAGLRPLLSGETDDTSKLSREHAVTTPVPGLVTVAGGKYTTYRVMAKDTIDVVARRLSGDTGLPVPESVTDHTPLLGADGYFALRNERRRLAADWNLPEDEVQRLLDRYGDLASDVVAIFREEPELAKPLAGAPKHLRAEIVYAVSHEGALHLDDVLTRRTRISIETPHRGVDSAPEAAALMAQVLGWDDAAMARELEHYRLRVDAERESQRMPDDRTADAARLGAPDVRTLGHDDPGSHPA